ncbi:uncharacterized protein BX663DRAFT_559348 [Cokeromyces recurvatus]|uniref:uncharacterized protein n=1 Tax=Cokeromyces recurvatus TaxID=90255 RepID=UPI00221E5A43|nr:uncharacterized protein BX663DRAFT_559348 [Cokeromyces recurvatus]KAI7905128.1 hypothetical protein BX663DRAFT_559348 [Cokeromyces recurvatus]
MRYLLKTSIAISAAFASFFNYVSAQPMIQSCKPGYVALTYDDGPNIYTSALVKLLNENGIKATFFVNGDNFLQLEDDAEAQDALIEAYRSGHQIASHTWSHKDLNEISMEEFEREISQLEDMIDSLIHVKPPYGSANETTLEILESKGYSVIEWSTDTKDYETHNLKSEMENVRNSYSRKNLDEGFIVLSHDVYEQTTVELTKRLIAYTLDEGFKFCTVAECINHPAYQ